MANVIMTEETLAFAFEESSQRYVSELPKTLSVAEGSVYKVIWDGSEYICIARLLEGAIALGNAIPFGGEDTGEPFLAAIIQEASATVFCAINSAESAHTIAIYEEDSSPQGDKSIVLYDRTGKAVTYENVETITTDTPTEGETATFTRGVVIDDTQIDLNLANGNQTVSVPDGYLVKEATIKKPETLLPQNIKKNVEVAGVVGEFAGEETEKTVELNMADGDQIIEADEDTVMTKVTVVKPDTLVPENIVEGVDIGGVVGTLASGGVLEDFIENGAQGEFTSDVASIRNYAFSECAALTSIDFPETTNIGNYAFSRCTALTSIDFPKATSIGEYAFYYCKGITSIDFPKATSIGKYAFYYCKGITSIDFPETTNIGNYAFSECTALTSIDFPKASWSDSGAFVNCTSLISVNLPNLYRVSDRAFWGCTALKEITLPGVKGNIEERAFYGCTELEKVDLSNTDYSNYAFEEIKGQAFYNCTSLTTLILRKKKLMKLDSSPTASGGAFYNADNCYIYVPSAQLSTYKSNSYWSTISSRIRAIEDYPEICGTT